MIGRHCAIETASRHAHLVVADFRSGKNWEKCVAGIDGTAKRDLDFSDQHMGSVDAPIEGTSPSQWRTGGVASSGDTFDETRRIGLLLQRRKSRDSHSSPLTKNCSGSALCKPSLIDNLLLKTRGTLFGDGEGAFEGDACCAEGAFFEEAADERDAVRYAAWRIEFWQRVFGIGRPVAAGF